MESDTEIDTHVVITKYVGFMQHDRQRETPNVENDTQLSSEALETVLLPFYIDASANTNTKVYDAIDRREDYSCTKINVPKNNRIRLGRSQIQALNIGSCLLFS